MTYPYSPQRIEDLGCGDHLCCFYKDEGEYLRSLVRLVQQGLARHEKVVCLIEENSARHLLEQLQSFGVDVQAILVREDLILPALADLSNAQGRMDPDSMIATFQTEKERAIAEGYTALRGISEAGLLLQEFQNLDLLFKYEEKLNELFPGNEWMLVCMYDQRLFDRETQVKILHLHPLSIVGNDLYDNFYHMPIAELIGREPRDNATPRKTDTGRLLSRRLPATVESDMRLYIP